MTMRHVGTQRIDTPRLLLRRHESGDAAAIFANWASDPIAARFWSWAPHESIETTRAILAQWLRAYDSLSYYHWAIVLKESMQPIGYIYLDSFDDAADSAAVHFLISRAFWHHGIATETCRAVIDFAFQTVGMKAIHSHHHADNPAAGCVLRKCGFRLSHSENRILTPNRISGLYHYYTLFSS